MIVNEASLDRCARCSSATVTVRDATAWCPACEWNLDRYEPDRHAPELGWRWVDRRTHRLAYRLTRQQFAALVQRPLARPTVGAAGIATVVASVLLLAGVALLAVAGGWLLVAYRFPALYSLVGLAALALAFTLRPRFGRLDPEIEVLSRERAPALFGLIDQVASAIDAPVPDIVAVDERRFTAYATCVGIRRRRVLCLGLPLWGSLPPQERVALLGHELGHFVNGDVRRLLLTQPAFTMLASAADLIRPVDTVRGGGIVELLGELLAGIMQATLARLLFGAHLVLVVIGLRDSQRAEYLADEMAARVAGSAAAASLFDWHLLADVNDMLVRRDARAGFGPADWRRTADEARAANGRQLSLLRQLSIRDDVSLFASHPPLGLRARMIEERTWREPGVVLTEAQAARIDAELSREYERTQRALGWTH